MADGVFTVDWNEEFQQLSRAPIVEAVIHWQARAQRPIEPDSLRAALADRLPMYPIVAPVQQFGLRATLSPADAPVIEHHQQAFLGLRLASQDGGCSVQFLRDGLIFSQTKLYEHWNPFASAAKAAWRVYTDLAAPVESQRLGVRFINHLANATPRSLHDYLRESPTCPSNLPLEEFVYQSVFAVPGHPFGVRVIKVMQPSMAELRQSSGLFLDIDVFTTTAVSNEPAALDEALAKMRWLKNKVFFTLLTESAVTSLT